MTDGEPGEPYDEIHPLDSASLTHFASRLARECAQFTHNTGCAYLIALIQNPEQGYVVHNVKIEYLESLVQIICNALNEEPIYVTTRDPEGTVQ